MYSARLATGENLSYGKMYPVNILILFLDPADTNYNEIFLNFLPIDAKAVYIFINSIESITASRTLIITNISGGPAYATASNAATGTAEGRGSGIVPLNTNRSIFYRVDNADVTSVTAYLQFYYA